MTSMKQPSKEMIKLYDENETFRTYVNKYALKHDLSLNRALQHKIIVDYANDIIKK